ncbi:MAG: hypothetical protein AAF913_14450, partial [Pseudomonadota bacterium]
VQLCHWQTWGVLRSVVETANPSDVEARAAITAVRPRLAPVTDPETLCATHTYALVPGNVVIEYYDQTVFDAVHRALATYETISGVTEAAGRRFIRLITASGFNYAVVDDLVPPIRFADDRHALAAVLTALGQIEGEDDTALLHLDAGLCGTGAGRTAIVLGPQSSETARRVIDRMDGRGLPPVLEPQSVTLLKAASGPLAFRIGKEDGAVRLIRRPQLFFTELETQLETLVADAAAPGHHGGFAERPVRAVPFASGPDEPFDAQDLVLLDIDPRHRGSVRRDPAEPAEMLFEVLRYARHLPKPRSVDDALALISWIEGRRAYRIRASSADAAAEAIRRG